MTSEQSLIEGLDGSALKVDGSVLTIEGADGRTLIHVDASELLAVNVAAAGPEEDAFIFVNFRDPDVSVEGIRMAYTPYRLRIHPKRVELAVRIATGLREQSLASRRWRPSNLIDPVLAVPHVDDVDAAAAVSQAASRMSGEPAPEAWLNTLIAGLHQTEVLLEMMRCTFRGLTGVLAITQRRALFCDDDGVIERPLAGVRWVYPQHAGSSLYLQDILSDTPFGDADPNDVERVIAAIERALRRQGFVGALRPRKPGIIELFEQFETITERVKLGMVTDEQAAHELAGICYATML